jgi:S1-C subfamily serine protease
VSNPLGLQHSVSRGVVSGLQREISGLEIGARLIQFDASINEGQSGGPLVDSRGSVVGVTTFKILGAEAIGFAIPIDLVRQTISDLERMGHPFRPEIGFSGTGVDPSLASLFELPVVWGVLVEQVEDDSVAERAGLRAGHRIVTLHDKDYVLGGDIIVAVDDAPIVGPTGLIDSFLNARPGQVLELEVVRGNKTVRIELTVPEMVH